LARRRDVADRFAVSCVKIFQSFCKSNRIPRMN
jgi:hypothetical protein